MEKKEEVKKQVEVEVDVITGEGSEAWSPTKTSLHMRRRRMRMNLGSSPCFPKTVYETIEAKGKLSSACQKQGYQKYRWRCCQHEGFRGARSTLPPAIGRNEIGCVEYGFCGE
ncbi:hypothetical protein EV426DRAFT_710762 [Tirmania nivea]|nr:hypothetical protein EV426DRAFT_710762 [Tirmania nivea]